MKPEATANKSDFSFRFKQKWFETALAFFFIATVFGALMRLAWIVELPESVDYKHLLHAHSHIAMLGWVFTALSGALLFMIGGNPEKRGAYQRVLGLNVLAGIGMAIFFTYQGYGALSIGFSTIHLLTAYYFAYLYLNDLRGKNVRGMEVTFARWAVYWMLFSSLGLWAIGPVSVWLGKTHALYYASIQFFLHFQFNGWFTYAVLALLIYFFKKRGKNIKIKDSIFWMLQLSLVLTYALSITWSTPETSLFYLNSLGVVLQTVAFGVILYQLLKNFRLKLFGNDITGVLLSYGLLSLLLKILIQSAVAIPAVAEVSYIIRSNIIGFIHLVVLGSISLPLLAILIEERLLPTGKMARYGYGLLILAFFTTELTLFTQGILFWIKAGFIPYFHEILLTFTLFFPIGLLMVLSRLKIQRNSALSQVPV
jgi:hypothetical protein